MKKTLAAVLCTAILLAATAAFADGVPADVRERSALAQTRFAAQHPGAVVHAATGRLPTLVTYIDAGLASGPTCSGWTSRPATCRSPGSSRWSTAPSTGTRSATRGSRSSAPTSS